MKKSRLTNTLPTQATVSHAWLQPDFDYPLNDHSRVSGFYHPWPIPRPEVDVWDWFMHRQPAKWPTWEENPVVTTLPTAKPDAHLDDWQAWVVGHATVLLRIGSAFILTDPVWAMRASPLPFAGPKRVRAAGLALAQLPKIDAVLLSHNHYDHMDVAALRWLHARDQMPIFAGLVNSQYLPKDMQVIELDWWQQAVIPNHPQLNVVFTPAQHFSGRGLKDRNLALWGGLSVITASQDHFFFAGDTGYSAHFAQIKDRLGAPRLALLPIGAYEPRSVMRAMHMDPFEAVQAHIDLAAKQSLAIHYRTFQLTDEAMNQPLLDLAQALTQHGLDPACFATPLEGEHLVV